MEPQDGRAGALLPGTPPPVLQALYGALEPSGQAALLSHLQGGTTAELLSELLGGRVSASTIRTYRRALRRTGATRE